MRVLVACEFSGIVRDAFAERGHDVWSCDLLPTESPGQHIQGDVLEILDDGWDLMIAHPPCQYLSYAAGRVWNSPGRKEKRELALIFFKTLYYANIKNICVENPVGYPNTVFRKPNQIVHPYFWGEDHMKKTCLWLKGLPLLIHTKEDDMFYKQTHIPKPHPTTVRKRIGSKNYKPGEIKNRYFTDFPWKTPKQRSITFPCIATAMASQWG